MHQFQLGQYKGLNIRPQPIFSEADLDTAVTEAISNMSYRWAKKNKPISIGDEIIVSVNAHNEDQIVPELCMADFKYTLGDPKLQEQFKNALEKKEGECFKMDIMIAQNNPIERVRGKLVHFEASILEVIPYKVDLNDAIAKEIDTAVSGMDELKSKLRQVISSNALQVTRENNLKAIFYAIIAHSTYKLDPDEFDKVYESIVQQNLLQQNSYSELLSLQNIDSSFYENCRSEAETTILDKLVLDAVAKEESIMLSEQFVIEKKMQFLSRMKENEETFNHIFPSEQEFYDELLIDVTCDFLLESNLESNNCKIIAKDLDD